MFLSHTHITPGLYHVTGQSKRARRTAAKRVSATRALVSSTALRDLKEAPGPADERRGGGETGWGGQERRGHSGEPWLPLGC